MLSHFSYVQLFVTQWTPGPTLCNPQEWVCLALLQRIFLTQGSNPRLMSPALAGRFFTTSATWEALNQESWGCGLGFCLLNSSPREADVP